MHQPSEPLDFRTDPSVYRHWTIAIKEPIAELVLNVAESAGIARGYELKQNSYDIGVDIELADAIQRLRFEHPEVHAVVLRSGKPGIFCAGANIRMLAGATHAHKVNFCKFTNETRNAIEEASAESGQRYLAAIGGTAAGGGYELALAADHLLLIDDGNAAVSLPEVPLLAVLPGTGGLTRLTDKRRIRRDLADVFCTLEEGVRGARALEWGLVDEIAPRSQFDAAIQARARALAALSDRPGHESGIHLPRLERQIDENGIHYTYLDVVFDPTLATATLTLKGPEYDLPDDITQVRALGAQLWSIALLRALDDALLYLRCNAPTTTTLVLRTSGNSDRVLRHDAWLNAHAALWWVREIHLFARRTLKRLDLTSRTLVALVEPGSCFAGFLAELLFAVDRSYMLDGTIDGDALRPASIVLTKTNFGALPMSNGITRLETRFYGDADAIPRLLTLVGAPLDAAAARASGLVTFTPDDIDWHDEIRLFLEERASFSPDALTAMEANLRFPGPETMETKIFARLSAWQNWVFQRPNAVGDDGALKRYGTGQRPRYDKTRI
jgi:benzoyl-CoA-dihydrodiol lyase